jgi:hypothetical protein
MTERTDITDLETIEASENEARLTGGRPLDEQGAFLTEADLDTGHTVMTDTEIYEGELEARGGQVTAEGDQPLESLTGLELREGETDNPDVAAEEGLTYIPPSDPPVVPGAPGEGPVVAAGFGSDALEEPYDEDHHQSALTVEDEMEARVREALRADATTSDYADRVIIGAIAGRVVVRGTVDDIDDTDNIVAVIERVTGVVEVVEELDVSSIA